MANGIGANYCGVSHVESSAEVINGVVIIDLTLYGAE